MFRSLSWRLNGLLFSLGFQLKSIICDDIIISDDNTDDNIDEKINGLGGEMPYSSRQGGGWSRLSFG